MPRQMAVISFNFFHWPNEFISKWESVCRRKHVGWSLMGQCHWDLLSFLSHFDWRLVSVSLQRSFMTKFVFSWVSSIYPTVFFPHRRGTKHAGCQNKPLFWMMILRTTLSSPSSSPKDTINHPLLFLRLTCWWTSSFSETSLNIKERVTHTCHTG